MVDSLFSFQDAATDYGDLANELLTTVLDGCGSRWTLKTAHTSDDEVRRTALDPPGSAKPPENRKLRLHTFTCQADGCTARRYSNAIGLDRLRRTAADC